MKRILCLWLPHWPIQRLIAVRPELRGRPLVLYARQGSRGQRVVAGSPEAIAMGVRGDMPLTEATALAGKSGQGTSSATQAAADTFHTELYDPTADRSELQRLAEWCEQFSPIVGLEPTNRTEGDL